MIQPTQSNYIRPQHANSADAGKKAAGEVSKVAGTAGAVTGGLSLLNGIVGAILAPITFGASVPVTTAIGAGLAAADGAAAGTAGIASGIANRSPGEALMGATDIGNAALSAADQFKAPPATTPPAPSANAKAGAPGSGMAPVQTAPIETKLVPVVAGATPQLLPKKNTFAPNNRFGFYQS